jgi:ankyrin repeat protein
MAWELLGAGSDVNQLDERGDTPLHHAALAGRVSAAELLLDHGADLNARNRFGATPLHRAAMRGHLEVVRLLIARGADVNVVDNGGLISPGLTPLDYAQSPTYDHPAVADLLLANGASARPKFTSLDQIVVGITTKAELLRLLGSPVRTDNLGGDPETMTFEFEDGFLDVTVEAGVVVRRAIRRR